MSDGFILLLHVVCITSAVLIVVLKPRLLPILLALLIPLGNFDLETVVTISFAKEIAFIFLLSLPIQIVILPRLSRRLRMPRWLFVFMLVACLSTLLNYFSPAPAADAPSGFFRGPEGRPVVQLASLALRVGMLVMVLGYVTDLAAAVKLVKATLFSTAVVAAYGIYEFVGFYSGWPIMGIHRAQPEWIGPGFFFLGSHKIFRIGSLVGEPKAAAKFLLASAVVIACVKIFRIKALQSWLTSYSMLVLHAVMFLLTFSTSGYFAIGLALPVTALVWSQLRRKADMARIIACALVVAAIVLCLVVYAGPSTAAEIFTARIIQRVGEVDNVDAATLQLLYEHPYYGILGVGLGNASFYIRPYFSDEYYVPLTLSPDSGYLRLLAEGGIFALLAFLAFLMTTLNRAARVASSVGGEPSLLTATMLVVCVVLAIQNMFASTEYTGQLWLYWGLLIAFTKIALAKAEANRLALGATTTRASCGRAAWAAAPAPIFAVHRR